MSEATLDAPLAQPNGRAWRDAAGTVLALAWPALLLVGALAKVARETLLPTERQHITV